jgi:hypothetical protein
VESFTVERVTDECFHMRANWTAPSGYNLTGQIQAYVVSWTENEESLEKTFLPGTFTGFIDRLNPNDKKYSFTVSIY